MNLSNDSNTDVQLDIQMATVLSSELPEDTKVLMTGTEEKKSVCPPELAFSALESDLSKKELREYEEKYLKGAEKNKDTVFFTWKSLKNRTKDSKSINTSNVSFHEEKSRQQSGQNPLFQAGIIPPDLCEVLSPQKFPQHGRINWKNRIHSRGRIITSEEWAKEIKESAEAKVRLQEEKKQRKEQRERKNKKERINKFNYYQKSLAAPFALFPSNVKK